MNGNRTPAVILFVCVTAFAVLLGCGGGGGGGGSTNATATAGTNATATAGTNSTATAGTNSTATAGTTGTPGDFPPDKIIFSTGTTISQMDPDGTNVTTFATLPVNYDGFAASPAGPEVAFGYSSNGAVSPNFKIMVNTTVDATNATTVDAGPYLFVSSLQFSPDGTKVVYVAQGATGSSGVYIANANGTGTPTRLDDADDAHLSPSGSFIVYTRFFNNGEICVRNVDGTGFTRLTNNAAEEFLPQWSKDGAKIFFSSDRSGSFDIWQMNANGTSPARVTLSGSEDEYGSSPNTDASQVAYTRISFTPANSGVRKVDVNGSNDVPLLLTSSIEAPIYWTSTSGRRGGAATSVAFLQKPSKRVQQILDGRKKK